VIAAAIAAVEAVLPWRSAPSSQRWTIHFPLRIGANAAGVAVPDQ